MPTSEYQAAEHSAVFADLAPLLAEQADVMKMCGIGQLLGAALMGYNVTIFVYGQTGSGKTFTMSGRDDVATEDGLPGAHAVMEGGQYTIAGGD